jgi:FkbM family methyltransferase
MISLIKHLDTIYHNLFDKSSDPYAVSRDILKLPVKIVFDVGANIGQTTARMLSIFPHATIYGFEPFPDSFEKYKEKFWQNQKVIPINQALSNKVGIETFFINKHHYTNSLLPALPRQDRLFHGNDDQLTNLNKIKIATISIDSFMKKNKINHIDLLKMDVQGGESLVLEGASSTLKKHKISSIYLEVSFTPLYKNQVMFYSIYEFLHRNNFRLVKLFDLYSDQKVLIQGDALFVHQSKISNND